MIQKYEIYRKKFRNLCFSNKQQQRCMCVWVFSIFREQFQFFINEQERERVQWCFIVFWLVVMPLPLCRGPSLKLFSGLCADTANIQPSEANKCGNYEITARIKRKQPNRINEIRPNFHWKMPNNKATGSQVVYKHPKWATVTATAAAAVTLFIVLKTITTN